MLPITAALINVVGVALAVGDVRAIGKIHRSLLTGNICDSKRIDALKTQTKTNTTDHGNSNHGF